MPFRLIEHTADVGVEGTATTPGGALANAGTALACVVTGLADPRTLRPETELVIAVEAPDRDALAVAFLSELLWRLEHDGLLWTAGGVELEEGEVWRAAAHGNAVRFDPRRHGGGVEVKAVTYHDLLFGRAGRTWTVRAILDI